jgi:putative pyruvate formate lyase activating enzyme
LATRFLQANAIEFGPRYNRRMACPPSTAARFVVPSGEFEPAYLALLRSGALRQRAAEAMERLRHCVVCPRDCGVDRTANKTASCHTGRYAQVNSYFPHLGEESCLRGWQGSGTIFFSMCNLRCVFCQNYDISQGKRAPETTAERLAGMMLELQAEGCHNINFVTPEHVVPQVIESVATAAERGLRLPLVYNTSAYDSLDSLQLLEGIVDIYMPDFKFWDSAPSLRYVKAKDYPQAARRSILEMHRQAGILKFDEQGLAKRGVLVRHLVMPGEIAGTESIMRFLANEVSRDTYVNMMSQYHPAGRVSASQFVEINRRLSNAEYDRALKAAHRAGLWRIEGLHPL